MARNKRKFCFFVCFLLFSLGSVMSAQTVDDLQGHPTCSYCGMNRHQFANSRMLIVYDDGSTVGTCSIHCAAVDLAINIDKTPKLIQVGDFKTSELVPADSATWVIGGSKQGVMTMRAKWAFEKKVDAEEFVKTNGGALASFDDAMKATYEDMYSDTKSIRQKRAMRRKMQNREQPGAPQPQR